MDRVTWVTYKQARTIVFSCLIFITSLNGFGQEKDYSEQIDSLYNVAEQYKELKQENEYLSTLFRVFSLYKNDLSDLGEAYKMALFIENEIELYDVSKISKELKIDLYVEIAWLIGDQGNRARAVEYYEKALDIAPRPLTGSHIDLQLFLSENRYLSDDSYSNQAMEDFNELLELSRNTQDSVRMYRIYEFIGNLYGHLGNETQELKFYLKSLHPSEPNRYLAFRNQLIASLYLNQSKLDSALIHGLKALEYSILANSVREQRLTHDVLKEIYAGLQDYERAFYHYRKFEDMLERHRSFEAGLTVGSANEDLLKREARLQEELANQKLANQRSTIIFIISVLLLLIFFALFIFNRLKLIQKQNLEIQNQKERVVQSERFKEQFLANMSHEIRTPMHAISGMINSLLRNKRLKTQESYLKAMHSSSNNLLVLLNDILDLSKVESGKIQIEQSAIDLKTLIEEVFSLLEYKAKEKNLLLTSSISEQVPAYIMSDRVRLIQILVNLIGNAIKFTEKGSITVSFDYLNSTLIGRVIDTGIGVQDSKKATIFDSYEQGSSLKSELKGTGLGLSITKQLIELQDGKISLESELGKGSTFTFLLPTESLTAPPEHNFSLSEEQLKKMSSELAGLKILIGEDNEFNIMVVKDDLEWYIPNVSIQTARTGLEVISKFQNDSFDLVLMDIQMPELDGYESSKRIREIENDSSTTPISIIAMSASLFNSEIEKCYQAGMNGYIPKPYKVPQLLSTIHQIVAEKKSFTS